MSDPKKKETYDGFGEVKEKKLSKTSEKNNSTKKEAIEMITEKLRRNKLTVEDLEENDRDYEREIRCVKDEEIHWKVEQIEERVKKNIDNIIKKKEVNADDISQISNDPNYSAHSSTTSVNIEEHLNQKYPKEIRNKQEILDISNKNLKGDLELGDFTNLKILKCPKNDLTNITFTLNLEKLTVLDIGNNKFSRQNLSIFSRFINLRKLLISFNNFYGSLEPLKYLTGLEELDISDTDIDSGLEYLPNSLEKIKVYSKEGECKKIVEKLSSDYIPKYTTLGYWQGYDLSD